jgi:hypothetical protein
MKKKYAFLLMEQQLNQDKDRANFETDKFIYYFCAVSGAKNTKARAVELMEVGVAAIELYGAFGPKLARDIIETTQVKVAVGYVIHDPDQDGGFEKFVHLCNWKQLGCPIQNRNWPKWNRAIPDPRINLTIKTGG